MAKPGQSSFRRILLSRLLLLSIPVLLTGEFVAYRKARSGLLETARNNLTESAIRKSDGIEQGIEALRATLITATETATFQVQSPNRAQKFLDQLSQLLPNRPQCIQLTNVATGKVEASTCGPVAIASLPIGMWPRQRSQWMSGRSDVRIVPAPPLAGSRSLSPEEQLSVVLHAPVYVPESSLGRRSASSNPAAAPTADSEPTIANPAQLRYVLSVQSALYRQEVRGRPIALSGHTVVIDQDGTILAHPLSDRVGRNIQQEADAARLQSIVRNAIAGQQNALHLFSFEKHGAEWLVGYSSVTLPMNANESRTWIVLAATPLGNALYSLGGIKQVLFILTLGLLTAILLATLYLTRDLALPIEQLGDYALRIRHRYASDRAPKNFKVKELNQLAEALDSMVERLEDRAEELEAAWQEAQAANQLKSEFLATTSHELRTPLNAIIGCIRLVRDGCCDDPEEEMEFLQQADDAAIHLLKIINDLLDIAKIEAGKVELNLQPVSIQDLCHQCVKMIQPGAEKKRLSLLAQVEPHLDRVPLDERRVRQMVINLLSNAVKFTPEGGQVKLSAGIAYGKQLEQDARPDHSPVNPTTPYLCLEVADSGIGIPKDRWHLLFRPFQQVDSSHTRKHEGTGLGLALTKRLAELHGGTISFQSVPGRGSTFRIWLPLGESDAGNKPTPAALEIDGNPLPPSPSRLDVAGSRA